MTAVQTIVKVRGERGLWSQHGTNHEGSINVFGPVIWSEHHHRYVGTGRMPRMRVVWPDQIRPAQLRLEVTT